MRSSQPGSESSLVLTQEEIEELSKPVRSSGGYQSLFRRLNGQIRDGVLILTPALAAVIVRYSTKYGSGGYQRRLRRLPRIIELSRQLLQSYMRQSAADSTATGGAESAPPSGDAPTNALPNERRQALRGLKGRLIAKSIDAFVLSLETINRLSVKYRVEAFAYLICNAWELLLKGRIVQQAGDNSAITYKDNPSRTLALRDCVARVLPNEKDPTRRNIERMAELRDEAVHLVISRVPEGVLCLFQSSVINYSKLLFEWFGISLSDRVPVGMMAIVYDFDPLRFDIANRAVRRELGRKTADYLAKLQTEIRREFEALGKPAEFSLDVDYRLFLTKKQEDADISLTSGTGGEKTHIVTVAKRADQTHPYRQKEVLTQVNSVHPCVNQYDFQCIVNAYDVKNRPEFHDRSKVQGSPNTYSLAFVDWILRQAAKDKRFFDKCRELARGKRGPK